jgi:hypothetical protein
LHSGIKIFDDKQTNSSSLAGSGGLVGKSFGIKPSKRVEYVDIDSPHSTNRKCHKSTFDIIKNNGEEPKYLPSKKMFPKMNGTL